MRPSYRNWWLNRSRISHAGHDRIELCAELEAVSRKAGNSGMVRIRTFNLEMVFGHILSGPNAAVPSYTDAPTGGPGISPAFGQGAEQKDNRWRHCERRYNDYLERVCERPNQEFLHRPASPQTRQRLRIGSVGACPLQKSGPSGRRHRRTLLDVWRWAKKLDGPRGSWATQIQGSPLSHTA